MPERTREMSEAAVQGAVRKWAQFALPGAKLEIEAIDPTENSEGAHFVVATTPVPQVFDCPRGSDRGSR